MTSSGPSVLSRSADLSANRKARTETLHESQTRADVDIAIVGGGVIGLACALRLQASGRRCLLLDAGAARDAASYGNAGHIATEQIAPLASWSTIRSAWRRRFAAGGPVDVPAPWAVASWLWRFVHASAPARERAGAQALRGLLEDAMPAWRRLVDDLDAPHLLGDAGHQVVWETERGAARGRAAWAGSDTGTAQAAPMPDALRTRLGEQLTVPLVDGLVFTGSGQIHDLECLREQLHAHFVSAGGMWMQTHARRIALDGDRAHLVLDDGTVLHAGQVLIAAGAASGRLMADVGHVAPVIHERGYHVHWRDHDWPAEQPPLVFEDRSVILTRFDHGLRLAGFVEFVAPGRPPDPRKWARLRAHAQALGLPVRGEGEAWVGSRPTLPDYLPAIGRSRRASNLYYAFGHQHLGLTLAATTAERVRQLFDDPQHPGLGAFALERFD